MDTNEISFRLNEARKALGLLLFHKQTLEAQLAIDEKKFYGQLVDQHGMPVPLPIEASTHEKLKERAEYYYNARELVNLVAEIRAKQVLIKEYEEHFKTSLKESTKAVSDKEILTAIQEMSEMRLAGKTKQAADQLADDFRSGRVVGLLPRFEYLQMVKNFIEANK